MRPLEESDPREIDGYALTGRLGAGGFGVVYAATAPDGRDVALKVLRPELSDDRGLRTRLAREAAALRSVRGDRNVQVFDVVTEGRWAYLVMELVEGDTLEFQVRNQGRLQGPMLWFVAEGLVEALADIHAAGIVHRDLKPSNVMFGPDGVKVLDFGVSAVAEQTALTQTGAFVGTAAWISPEQIRDQEATPASDVFNLAMVVGYAALGRHPFGGGRSDAVMYRISNEQPDLAGVASPLQEALERCLQRDPADRPTIDQLREFFATNDASTLTPTRPASDTGTVIVTPAQPDEGRRSEEADDTAVDGEQPPPESEVDDSPAGPEDTRVVGTPDAEPDSGGQPPPESEVDDSSGGSEDTRVAGSTGGGAGADTPVPVPPGPDLPREPAGAGSGRNGARWLVDVWGPDSDTTPPVVTLISVTPTLIEPGDKVTVTWSAADSSGLDLYSGNYAYTKPELGPKYLNPNSVTRISGDRYDGVYQGQLTMFGVDPGGLSLRIYAKDNLDNGIWVDFGHQVDVGSG